MPDFTSSRIDSGSGDVSYTSTEETSTTSTTTESGSTGSSSTSTTTTVQSVVGTNTGTGVGIYRGLTGSENIVLEFKTLVAGENIEILESFSELLIRTTGGVGATSFRGLSDTPGTITPNGLLFGSSTTTLQFTAAPETTGTVLTWDGEAFVWQAQSGTVSSVEIAAGLGISVTGSPITDQGTITVGLASSGVTPGSYVAPSLVIDSTGRVTGAISNTLGEINTGANIGTGASIYAGKMDAELLFRSIVAGTGITVVEGEDEITIGATATVPTVTATGDATGTSNATGAAIGLPLTLTNTGVVPGTYAGLTIDSKGRVVAATSVGYLSANQTITLTGDASGSGETAITVALTPTGVAAGTYNRVVVDTKGRVTSASTVSYLTGNQTVTIDGDATGSGATAISLTLADTGVTAGTYNRVVVDSKGRVTAATNDVYLTANQTITVSGDATGSGTTAIALTLSDTGVVPGTYGRVEVDAKGRVVSAAGDGSVALTGDVTASSSYGTLTAALVATGVAAGTYGASTLIPIIAVDSKGRVTSLGVTGLQGVDPTVTISGDVTGSGVGTITVSLTETGVSAGTYSKVAVDAAGRVTAGLSLASGDITGALGYTPLSGNDTISLTGDATGTGTNSITVTLVDTGIVPGTYGRVVVDAKGRVTGGAEDAALVLSGDVTTAEVEGAIVATLTDSGVTAGTYGSATEVPVIAVDGKGRVTSVTMATIEATDASVTLTGDVSGNGVGTINVSLAENGVTPGTYATVAVDATGRVTAGASLSSAEVTAALGYTPISSNQTITLSGDASGSGDETIEVTLADTGVTPGTYTRATVTVDSKGRVVAAQSAGTDTMRVSTPDIYGGVGIDVIELHFTGNVSASLAGIAPNQTMIVSVDASSSYSFRVNFDSSGNIDATNPFPAANLPSGWTVTRDTTTQLTVTHGLGRVPMSVMVYGEKSGTLTQKIPNGNPTAAFSLAVPSSTETPNTFTMYGFTATATNSAVSSYALVRIVI